MISSQEAYLISISSLKNNKELNTILKQLNKHIKDNAKLGKLSVTVNLGYDNKHHSDSITTVLKENGYQVTIINNLEFTISWRHENNK